MNDRYYVMIKDGISVAEVIQICHMLSMWNLRQEINHVVIWLASDSQIKKLTSILDILDTEYEVAKSYKIE